MRRYGFLSWFLAVLALVPASASSELVLTGTVLTPENRPAAGARVELLPILGPAPVASTQTDVAGRFVLQAPSVGLWKVVVRSSSPLQSPPLPVVEPLELPPAQAGAWAPFQPELPATPPQTEPLVLSGQVVDESSRKPIPGALVWASADPGAFVRTDAEGRFQVTAPGRRRFDLEVLAPGYLLKRVLITRPQLVSRKTGTLALARAGKLRGKVVDPQGRPLAAATVLAISQNALGQRAFSPADPVTDRTVTDPQGRFELRRVRPEQSYEIRVSRAGAFPVAERATVGEPPRDLTLVVFPARTARGKVQDPAGKPIAGAEAIVRPALRPGSSDNGVDDGTGTQSDAQGVFSLPELPAAEVELTVSRKGYAPALLPALRIPAGTSPADLGVVTLRPGATLTGRVVDHRGQAVPGGEIFLLDKPASPNEMERALKDRKPGATVEADGRFSIEDLAQGSPVHVAVRSPGFLIAQVRSVRPPTEKPVVIRLEPEAALAGRVVDEAGAPVPGARIDLHWQAFLPEEPDRPVGQPILRNTRADGEGRFELRGLPTGTARVSVAAPSFVPLEGVEVDLPRAGELRLVLERGALLQGRVTTAAGEPVPGVRVGVSGAGASTNDDGLYWLEGAELGRQEVIFLHPSHGRVAKRFEIQPGINVLDLTFEPGVEVAGRVVDGTGKPVPGAKVELTPEYRFDPRQYRDVTGEDGRFRLSTVVAGRYRLKAGADGFTETQHPGTLAVLNEPVSNLEITLDKGAMLSGNILGLPAEDLAQVEVEARGDNGDTVAAWTDGRGRYEVRSLAPGDWTVTARLWDDQRQAKTRVAIRRSDREVIRDLEFEKRLALTIQVLYDEEPLPDARVSVRGQRITAERTAMTDYEGRVRFDDLAPETYRVGLRHDRNMVVHNDQVDVQQDRDLVIRLQGATIGGLVVSAADGGPVPDAMLLLRPVEGPEYLVTAGTKSDGRFRVYRVQPNRYRLQASADGFLLAEQELQVAAGQTLDDLEVRLQPAQGARVRVRLASGEIPARVHMQVRDMAGATALTETHTPHEAGIFELSKLPPGTWTLIVAADGGAVATASLVVPSEELVELTLPPAGQLNVRVPALLASDLIGTVRLLGQNGQTFWTLGPGGDAVQQWPLAGGKAVVDGVPPGSWIVQVETPDGQRWQGAAVTAGSGVAAVTIE
ncbi:MAG TPA: carboxypeptidase regulatory-like domain-containing protein [Thermoanaerobaculia bacterium]|nr:carboxypeptidase regulatory-like domain-containing protein [Thermoanaerobaculia bacterium]